MANQGKIIVGARYNLRGFEKELLFDTETKEVIMKPGTTFINWILGILWDKRFLRRGRSNTIYKLNMINAINGLGFQWIYQVIRLMSIRLIYEAYIDFADWPDNGNKQYLLGSTIALFITIQLIGMSSDRFNEELIRDNCRTGGLQAGVNTANRF